MAGRAVWAATLVLTVLALFVGLVCTCFRSIMATLLQWRLAELGCSGLPITLRGATLRCWSIELRGLRIGNPQGAWRAPFALQMDQFRIDFGSFLGLLSCHPGFPPQLYRLGMLELTLGFRIKSVQTLDIHGLKIFVEDAHEQHPTPATVLKQGLLHKKPMNGRLGSTKKREFTLEDKRLSWYEPVASRKLKGSLRLYASSLVELDEVEPLTFHVLSGPDRLAIIASSEEDRNEWASAIQRAIVAIPDVSSRGIVENNAPWMAAIVAEDEGRKLRWRRRAEQRRRDWRTQWQSSESASGDAVDATTTAKDDGQDVPSADSAGKARNPLTDFLLSLKKQAVWAQRTAATGARMVEQAEASAAELRFEESVEFMIGRMTIHSFMLSLTGQHFQLAPEGWELRGFVGSENELKSQLFYVNDAEVKRNVLLGRPPQMGLVAKLMMDSGQRAVSDTIHDFTETIGDFTGKDEYQVGDISRAAIRRLGQGVAITVSEFTGKDDYRFGDISRAAIAKVTGKEDYQFGDISRAAIAKVTGKEDYQFGDISRAAITKVTGKDDYQFGDISRAAIAKVWSLFAKTPNPEAISTEKGLIEQCEAHGEIELIAAPDTEPADVSYAEAAVESSDISSAAPSDTRT